jgi:3-hydroxyisobutyrate dehydrogenase
MIAFFGTGLLGAGFVRALLRNGETVHVWNRTADKARALEADGARAFDDPAEAVKGAERLHMTLGDDASVDDVLERARPGIRAGMLVVDHSTTSASGTEARVRRWDERGIRFLHAPVFMGPQNALQSTGLMVVSGERTRVDAARPHLQKMTGKLLDVGERAQDAGAFKLLGNLFLIFFNSGLAEMFTLARALGVEPRTAASLFDHFNPGNTIDARVDRMLGGDYAKASWELAMARKDTRLMLEEAARGGLPLPILPAVAARMDQLIAEGHGRDDWTVLGKDAVGKVAGGAGGE